MKNNFISIKLRRSEWQKVNEAINSANYCVVKNMNGKRFYTFSKFAQDSKGFKKNKYLSKKINDKLNKNFVYSGKDRTVEQNNKNVKRKN